eukprot:scaffold46981_cov21-Tisochrysis_lutea.AAC.3
MHCIDQLFSKENTTTYLANIFPHPEPSILSCTQVEDIQVSEPGNVQILTHDGKLIKASAGQGACMDALGPIVVHGCLRLPAITS